MWLINARDSGVLASLAGVRRALETDPAAAFGGG
jgi:hypothetical protein